MTAYGYARVSTGRQADEGESLGTQERMIGGYCAMKGYGDPVMYIERGVSGSVPLAERSQGKALLKVISRGDALIVPKMDRAFRSSLDALEILARFQRESIELHMIDLGGDVTGGGISKLVFTILAAVAEGERDSIRERIQEVKSDQAKRGRYLGGCVPFGFVVDESGTLVPAPERSDALAMARALRAEKLSLRAIADRMNAAGHNLSYGTVKRLLDKAA